MIPVPQLMSSLGSLVKITVVGTVEHVQAIKDILACMRVNDVQKNSDPEAVSGVY
jgi:hypothetical protein